jgi:hypothetical protein
MRFNKDKIDGVCKDIRYPDEFFIDLIFDEEMNKSISNYESDVSKWKSIISDFVLKSFKSTVTTDESGHTSNDAQVEEVTNKAKISISSASSSEVEEDITAKPNTLNKAEEILQKFSSKEEIKAEDEEEDMEDYLNSLENK